MNGDFGCVRFRDLPYDKGDSVADLDAVRIKKARKPKPPKPAVPSGACALSGVCELRRHRRCDALNCKAAADYMASL